MPFLPVAVNPTTPSPLTPVLASTSTHPVLPAHLPAWLANRALDVRAYDRREMREVYGPSHSFHTTSDILLTNGMMRVWVGNVGLAAYLNVSVFKGGTWREVGCLLFGSGTDVLTGARLTRLTADSATLALHLLNQGTVQVRMQRCSTLLRITHGSRSDPSLSRYLAWTGATPFADVVSGSVASGAMYNWGLRVTAGLGVPIAFPPTLDPLSFAVALRWIPDAASSSQASSGLLAFWDGNWLQAGTVQFSSVTKTIQWARATSTVSSPPLTFSMNAPIMVVLSTSPTARTISTGVGFDPMTHIAGAVGPSPNLGYSAVVYGGVGGLIPRGLLDNAMTFDSPLTADEITSLQNADRSLANLPRPESRLVQYNPFDTELNPTGSDPARLAQYGMHWQSNGDLDATADHNGVHRGLVSLQPATVADELVIDALAIRATGTGLRFGAYADRTTDPWPNRPLTSTATDLRTILTTP